MKINFDLKNKYPSVEFCYNNKCIMIRYWGGLKFDRVVLYCAEQFKNKEEPIQEILENLENQLKKVIKEHPIDVNEDNYWRGVKIGLETAVEVIKFKVW